VVPAVVPLMSAGLIEVIVSWLFASELTDNTYTGGPDTAEVVPLLQPTTHDPSSPKRPTKAAHRIHRTLDFVMIYSVTSFCSIASTYIVIHTL
jgi:hypothetical protein